MCCLALRSPRLLQKQQRKMELKENSMKIIIESMDKKVIYSFLEEFKKEVTNSSINYFEDKKIYEVVLNVQIIK